MISVRLGVFAGLTAVALWGLFSLLENLREPELLRSPKAVVIKGCEPLESDEARRLCPQLLCQKALLDTKAFSIKAQFETTVDRRAGNEQLVGGVARIEGAAAGEFVCILDDGKVSSARAVEHDVLAALAAQSDSWSLDEAAE